MTAPLRVAVAGAASVETTQRASAASRDSQGEPINGPKA
jgi:hypothetical protein